MIRYVTLGADTCDETARFHFRNLNRNTLNAFCLHEAGS